MSIYINVTTGEYPRHQGDIELSPNDQWEIVEHVNPPEFLETQVLYEETPEIVNGRYVQKWAVREMNASELERLNERKRFEEIASSFGLGIVALKNRINDLFP